MFESVKNVHLIGAGGIGISAVGKLLLHHGKRVTGSDVVESEQVLFLRKAGAEIKLGHMAENMPNDTELVIYSPAVPEENLERAKAKENGITEMSYPSFLGALSKNHRTIAVTGTHGKSTTTAMIGSILKNGLDPTVIVGSKVPGWEHGNLRIGTSDILVIEACEHHANMNEIHPTIGVITNIEEDHLDHYKDIEAIKAAFQTFIDQSGIVVINGTDRYSMELSLPENADVITEFEPIALQVPGVFNQRNARMAERAVSHLDVDTLAAERGLGQFPGIWRRFERLGTWHGAEIISDYAHHPTAIRATLEAAREQFPDKRIVLCFQPHQHSRTIKLFNDFIPAFDGADVLILSEIYRVEGRLEDEAAVSSKELLRAVQAHDEKRPSVDRVLAYASDLNDAERTLRAEITEGDVVIIMGAGDIDDVARRFETD